MTRVGVVAIGRNEGQRLVDCLDALRAALGADGRIVYVDSGSTDGSVAEAEARGVEVVELDLATPFTAARARNAGIDRLRQGAVPEFVQFVDGDCTLDPDWLPFAIRHLDLHPNTAAVSGRLRERFPEASLWNRLCDDEWNTPVGQAKACGGIAMMRMYALDQVAGFNPRLIAGEEPEMCLRMRAKGWEIWRIDAEMALHDAAMTRFSQYWKRTRRGGHAWAEGAAMHGRSPERHGVRGLLRALGWGLALPLLALLGTLLTPWALLLLLAYPLQIARLALKAGGSRYAWAKAALMTLGKVAEAQGALGYARRRLTRAEARLIEYK